MVSFQLGTPSMRYECHLLINYINLQVKPVWKLKNILFNIEYFGEFFCYITPTTLILNVATEKN